MISEKQKHEAQKNFVIYLRDGLLVREKNDLAKKMYMENAELSLKTAHELMQSQLKPYLWVVVVSYYSMFYIANAALLHYGYKTQGKIVHKVTSDALIVLVINKLKEELIEYYKALQRDAMEIAGLKAESLIESYSLELDKRSRFQYNMLEQTKESRAATSLKRASEFVFELRKLIVN